MALYFPARRAYLQRQAGLFGSRGEIEVRDRRLLRSTGHIGFVAVCTVAAMAMNRLSYGVGEPLVGEARLLGIVGEYVRAVK